MTRLFDGEVDVAYFQFYVETPEVIPGDDVAVRFAGQTNGLCGAGEPGMLQCTTGSHTGVVPVAVDMLEGPPDEIDAGATTGAAPREGAGWEEVVEVSLTTTTPTMLLYDWDHQYPVELALGEGTFRVRYHASGLQAGTDGDVREPGEPVRDRYLLQFWPAPPGDDAVLRHTSELAAYWHDTARNTADPERGRGGAPEEDDGIVAFRAMIEGVTTSSLADQRAAACWLARHAAADTDPAVQAWLEPALAALERGETLPDPFTDLVRALELAPHPDQARDPDAVSDPGAPGSDPGQRLGARKTALLVLHDAADPDPTTAFMGALARTQVRPGLPEREVHATLHARFAT